VATVDILTQLRSTLPPHPDEASRGALRVSGTQLAGESMAGGPPPEQPPGPPPGWVPHTTRPPRSPHEPGA
jgi:hypothetical protein